jgi:uncharacterized radical SAM superfamily Fe-S cluster-containing enzyme
MSKQVLELARPARLVDLSRFNLSTRYKTTLLNEGWQNVVKRQFALPEHTRVVKTSLSVCPVCNRRIPMAVYEENGAIWLKKVCPEHGAFEDLYWGDAEMYYYFLQWDTPEYIAKGLANPYTDLQFYTEMGSCPMGCGLCPVHKSDTVLAIVDVTNRCNMACPVCFANAGAAGYVYEPTLEQIEYMLRTLRAQRPWPPNALQLSGGEPTLRDDLPEIVRMAKKLGFTHIEVNTNGIRLANEPEFYKALLDAGISTLYLQFDTIDPGNEGVVRHRLYNPKAYAAVRRRLIEVARQLGHRSIVPVVTLARGYNDKDLGKILDFAIQNRDVIRWINIQPVSFAGRARLYSKEELRKFRITIPDTIIEVERQTGGLISRWDWRPTNWPVAVAKMVEALTDSPKPLFSMNPVCGAATFIYYDDDEKKIYPITKLVDVDAFERIAWDVYRTAKRGRTVWKAVAATKAMKLLRTVKHRKIKGLIQDFLVKKDYDSLGQFFLNIVGLGIMHFMDVMNFDVERIQRCDIHYATPDGRVVPFCTYNNFHRERIEQSFRIDPKMWTKITGVSLTGWKRTATAGRLL